MASISASLGRPEGVAAGVAAADGTAAPRLAAPTAPAEERPPVLLMLPAPALLPAAGTVSYSDQLIPLVELSGVLGLAVEGKGSLLRLRYMAGRSGGFTPSPGASLAMRHRAR